MPVIPWGNRAAVLGCVTLMTGKGPGSAARRQIQRRRVSERHDMTRLFSGYPDDLSGQTAYDEMFSDPGAVRAPYDRVHEVLDGLDLTLDAPHAGDQLVLVPDRMGHVPSSMPIG